MLNKELLMGSTQGTGNVNLTIGHFSNAFGDVYGYLKSPDNSFGSLDLIPYWGTTGNVITRLTYATLTKNTLFTAPRGVTVFVAGYPQYISAGDHLDSDPYSMSNSEGAIRYLTFDPPRRVLGSRNTQTDLRRGYYVEEAHWEAQDAEQEAVNGTEPELQPSLRHPTVLRRTQQRDVLHLDFSRWNFKD